MTNSFPYLGLLRDIFIFIHNIIELSGDLDQTPRGVDKYIYMMVLFDEGTSRERQICS